jgi:hypothetical protein
MRWLFIVLLAVAVAVAADASAVQAPKRVLRASPMTLEDTEERAFTIPGVEKLSAGASKVVNIAKLPSWKLSGKSADDVFLRLKLDKAGYSLFKSPDFENWAKYMTMTNKQNPEGAMLSALSSRFSEKALAEMLAAATKYPGVQQIARKMQVQQVKGWVAGGQSSDEVFTLLTLDTAGEKLLGNANFKMWVSFVTQTTEKNPYPIIASILTARYGDEALAQMLIAAKDVKNSKTMGEILSSAQTNAWLRGKKPTDDVFKILKLDQSVDDVLTNPAFATWKSYVDTFNKQNPGKETSIIKTFTASYGDEKLSKMLEAAKKSPNTNTGRGPAGSAVQDVARRGQETACGVQDAQDGQADVDEEPRRRSLARVQCSLQGQQGPGVIDYLVLVAFPALFKQKDACVVDALIQSMKRIVSFEVLVLWLRAAFRVTRKTHNSLWKAWGKVGMEIPGATGLSRSTRTQDDLLVAVDPEEEMLWVHDRLGPIQRKLDRMKAEA